MNWLHWSLLAAFFASLTAILGKVGVAEVNSHLATAVRTVVVLAMALLAFGMLAPDGSMRTLTTRQWILLGLSGAATGLSWLCYYRALQLGDAMRVASVDKLSVVFVVMLAVLFLNERASPAAWLGCLLMAGGSILLVTSGR